MTNTELPSANPRPAAEEMSLVCNGTLTSALTGYSLQDMRVELYFLEPSNEIEPQLSADQRQNRHVAKHSSKHGDTETAKGQEHSNVTTRTQTLLGIGTSGPDGFFQIDWVKCQRVDQYRCLLRSCSFALTIFKVFSSLKDKHPVYTSEPSSWGMSSTKVANMAISLPLGSVDLKWSEVSKRLGGAHIDRLSILVRELVLTPTSSSIFGDWSSVTRQAAVVELEKSFLDPESKLSNIKVVPTWKQLSEPDRLEQYKSSLGRSLDDPNVLAAYEQMQDRLTQFPTGISAVDWKIDISKLTKNVAIAINAFPHQWDGPIFQFKDTESIGYRDYLVRQWTTSVTRVELWPPPASGKAREDVGDALAQLKNRFHQNFAVDDTLEYTVNDLLIPILRDILTSPKGTKFGFGFLPIAIPPQNMRTSREYLDLLISMTTVSARELSLRYRTDFTRPDSILGTPVWENIHTLQGFFRDSFQSVADPSHTDPDVLGQQIVPDLMRGKAPFFLEYDEWLVQQQPIPFENFFLLRNVFDLKVNDFGRQVMNTDTPDKARKDWATYALKTAQICDLLNQAYDYMDKLEYSSAAGVLEQIMPMMYPLLNSNLVQQVDLVGIFQARRRFQVKSLHDLTSLIGYVAISEFDLDPSELADISNWPIGSNGPFADWLDREKKNIVCGVYYLQAILLPMLIAQTAYNLGDYPKATLWSGPLINFLIGKAHESDDFPYMIHDVLTGGNESDGSLLWFPPYFTGNLPYTVDTAQETHDFNNDFDYSGNYDSLYYDWIWFRSSANARALVMHPIEKLFFCQQMADMILEWADSLYRTDETANISRARELYKAVHWIHGIIPPINPRWDSLNALPSTPMFSNPVKVSQIKRAQRNLLQISSNLNFFGFSADTIPVLRYSRLKQAADAFAASAVSVERDFLDAVQQIENITVETFKNISMLKHAAAQVSICDQQVGIANDQVVQGNVAVAVAQAALDAKEKEIEDHDSFWTQLSDYFKGMKDIVNFFPDDTKSAVGASIYIEAGQDASTAGLLGLGTTATLFAGMGAFWVASYFTLESMDDAQDSRQAELAALRSNSIPAAQAQLDIANRTVQIANFNQAISAADATLAKNLAYFTETGFLNAEFWSYLAVLFKRTLRQYLDLAARTGWLAERALAYELDTTMGQMKFDYYNAYRRGAGSAEQLQLDLTSLEAKCLGAQAENLPIKYTISLARDFPLQFAKLRTTGKCVFQTLDDSLRNAYPGTYGHRVVAIQTTLGRVSPGTPLRGLLTNGSQSLLTMADGTVKMWPHPTDALPISEFNIETADAQLQNLPGNTLMPFEGSGVNTFWTLEFPAAANPAGLGTLADVLLTMNVRARFSSALHQKQVLAAPTKVSKGLLFSTRRSQPDQLDNLKKSGTAIATIFWSLSSMTTAPAIANRKLNNVFFVVAGNGKGLSEVKATVQSQTPHHSIDVVFKDGVAFSNSPPITDAQSTVPLSPLNALTGIDADQHITLTIKKSNNSGVDFTGVKDIVIGVDYSEQQLIHP